MQATEQVLLRTDKLRLSVLGGFSLNDPHGEPVSIINRKARALLAYLALSHNHSETRERLVGLLWSDRDEEKARASLRQTLKQLRLAFDGLGFEGFKTDRMEVMLDPRAVVIDLYEIEQMLAEGRIAESLFRNEAVPERILYGFEALDQSFATWLYVTRQNWHDRFVEGLGTIMLGNDQEAAKRAAEAIVCIDTTHETAHRYLIRYHASSGNIPAALKQYKLLWDLLDEVYDMEPDDETQALIADVKGGTFEVAAADRKAVRSSPGVLLHDPKFPILQVHPFVPGGNFTGNELVVEGFRQDLISSLVRFREWVVLDWRQLELNGNERQADELGTLPGPLHLIDGTFFEDRGHTHLVVTLKRAETGRFLWSERMQLDHDNWFAAQRQFVMRISAGLSIYLSAQNVAHRIAEYDVPADMYELWLDAYRLIWSWEPEVRNRAEAIFRKIIAASPSFAPAYSGLASILNTSHVISPGVRPEFRQLEEAAQMARTAVSLDPLDVRNQVALAWSCGMTGRYDQAENYHRQVYDLNPNNPNTLISSANGLAMCGRSEEASAMAEEAVRLLPSISAAQWGYLASTRFLTGDYQGCIEAADLAGVVLPVAPGWRAAALGKLRRIKDAKIAGQDFMSFVRSRWQGQGPCEARAAALWFLGHCPVKHDAALKNIKEGLAVAGLPVL